MYTINNLQSELCGWSVLDLFDVLNPTLRNPFIHSSSVFRIRSSMDTGKLIWSEAVDLLLQVAVSGNCILPIQGGSLVSRGSLVSQFGSLVSVYCPSSGATATTTKSYAHRKAVQLNKSFRENTTYKPPHLREPPPSARVTSITPLPVALSTHSTRHARVPSQHRSARIFRCSLSNSIKSNSSEGCKLPIMV
jgi:hypothetical protein